MGARFHQWYLNKLTGEPKSRRRPRTCEHCRENPKGACPLPFRKLRPVRLIAQMDRRVMGGVEHRRVRRVR